MIINVLAWFDPEGLWMWNSPWVARREVVACLSVFVYT